ncbi:hypothetical protein OROHE_005464 [Orobanche hederae]
MPPGKYSCDYCNKQFQDTPASRRRHLLGIPIREPNLSGTAPYAPPPNVFGLNEVQDTLSTAKGVCNRFVRTLSGLKYDSHTPCILDGSCQYGDSCKYYHPKKSLPNMNTQGVEALLFGNPTGMSLGNLPPSLWPPPEGGYPPLPFIDWG